MNGMDSKTITYRVYHPALFVSPPLKKRVALQAEDPEQAMGDVVRGGIFERRSQYYGHGIGNCPNKQSSPDAVYVD